MDEQRLGGRYRLLEAHAVGGMASVWRALDEATGQIVAVKRLHPALAADERARARVRREAEALAAVRHPNVVVLRDVITDLDAADRDGPVIVMDFVPGRTLADRLAAAGPMSEPDALAVGMAIAEGLAAVHAAGIVHRDVKPANILIGDDGTPRLTDFGIASDMARDATSLTVEDGVIGTFRYLAPERLVGASATPATDVWGLGRVLQDMLAGGEVSTGTLAVLERALDDDPALRQQDGGELARELAAATATIPASGRGDVADPWSPTVVVPLPSPTPGAAPDTAGSAPLPQRGTLGRRTEVAAAGIALALGLGAGVLVMADRAGSPDPSAAALPAPVVRPTSEPAATDAPTIDQADAPNADGSNGKGKGKGKGKGNGNGRGD